MKNVNKNSSEKYLNSFLNVSQTFLAADSIYFGAVSSNQKIFHSQ